MVASEARDLWEGHRHALDAFGVREVSPGRYPGAEFLQPFIRALGQCSEYIEGVV